MDLVVVSLTLEDKVVRFLMGLVTRCVYIGGWDFVGVVLPNPPLPRKVLGRLDSRRMAGVAACSNII